MDETKHILIVDDEPEILLLVAKQIQDLGYSPTAAPGGAAGLEALRKQEFLAVLIDLEMPAMSGLDLLAAMRDLAIETVPIVLSGFYDPPRVVAAMKAGAFDFVEKPWSRETLRTVLTRAEIHGREMVRARALASAAEHWEAAFDSSPDPIIVLDPQRRIIRCNRVVVEQAGTPKKAIIGRTCHEALCGDDHPVETCLLNLQCEEEGGISFGHFLWGRHFEVKSVPLKDRMGVLMGSMHVLRDVTGKRVADKALRDSEEKFRTLYESASDAIMILGQERFTDCNQATLDIFRCASREEFCSFGPADLSPPFQPGGEDSRSLAKERIALALTDGRNRFEWIHMRKDGEEFPAEVSLTATVLAGRRVIQAVVHDITNRKRAEEELRTLKQRLEFVLQVTHTGINIMDSGFNLLYVDPGWVKTYGEPAGRKCHEYFQLAETPCPNCDLLKALKTKTVIVSERCLPKENDRPTQVTSMPFQDEEGRWLVAQVTVDITERKRAEEKIHEAFKQTELVISSISSIFIGVDEYDRVARWNSAAETAFAIPAARVLGQPFEKCGIHWDWRYVLDQITKAEQDGKFTRLDEIEYTRPDGKKGVLGLTLNPIVKENGGRAGFLMLGRDITERKLLDVQFQQARKLESIGQLAAGIAHEVNSPTQYVLSNTRFLEKAFCDLIRFLEKEKQLLDKAGKGAAGSNILEELAALARGTDLEYLSKEIPTAITESIGGLQRIAGIVQAMKEFSHPGSREKTPVDINRAIENTVMVARNEWKYVAGVETRLAKDLPLVPALPGEIQQVFLNMIVNAAHAIAARFQNPSEEKGRIYIETRVQDRWAEILISDNGIGMSKEVHERIFDPFFTTKEVGKGSGQGLTISRSIVVDKHGGEISVETEIDKGTAFTIRLPIGEKMPPRSPNHEETG